MEMEMANVKALKAGLIFISWVCLKIGQLFRVGYGNVMNSLRKSMNESGHTQFVCFSLENRSSRTKRYFVFSMALLFFCFVD
jgi:hypothetical protein